MEQPKSPPGKPFVIVLGLTALITPLAVHLFFPVIPAVKAALGLTDAHAQLTFSISLFGMAFATLFYGSLSDRYGRRPVLLSGLALFLIGSVVSAVAETANALVAGRLIQAVGAGSALTLVRAIARDAFRAEQLVKAIAYLTMFGTLGPMVSPAIGGVLIDMFGWRSVFWFALGAGFDDRRAGLARDGGNPAAREPRQVARKRCGKLRRTVRPDALQCLRVPVRLQHRHLHGDGGRVSLADDRIAAPAGHRVRTLFHPVPGWVLHRQFHLHPARHPLLDRDDGAGRLAARDRDGDRAGGHVVLRAGHAARILHSGVLHHHGAGHRHALRAGGGDVGDPPARRHGGGHRRVPAAPLRRGIEPVLRAFSPTARRAR